MGKHIKRDLIGRKSLLVLLKLTSLPGIVHRSLALLIGVLLLSESVAATPVRMGVSITQQPAVTSQDAAAAQRIFQEGMQLYRQQTAESLRQAIAKWEEALPLYRAVGDKKQEAVTLLGIGRVYFDLGEKQKALDYYNQSLPVSRAVGDRAGEATTLGNIAFSEGNRGNLNEALTQIEAAINIIEDLRTKIDNQQLRASYFATVQHYYKLKIDLLMQLHKTNPSKGYDAQALQTSERARARSLLELLTEAHANIRQGVDPKLVEQERTIQQQLDALEQRRFQLLNSQYTNKQLAEIKQQQDSLNTQLEQVQNQIRQTSPRYAALKYPQPLLWSVNDKGTSELMSRFYKKMLQEGQKPAAALRTAQIEMLQSSQWKEPYYWAAFTLQGEWK